MNQYLLSVMKGRRRGFWASAIILVLLPCSLIYRLGVFLHRQYFKFAGSYKASKPVISIGNITVGGVGKTPLVIWLARILKDRGIQPIILTRGYMQVASRKSDEADMLSELIPDIPVLTGSDRVANIRKLNDAIPHDVFICDDAFQHWPLDRDLNIVAIDTVNPFGNGHLLPSGILREPLSGLKRADVFVLTKIEGSRNVERLSNQLKEINPGAFVVETRYKAQDAVEVFNKENFPLDFFKDKPLVAFCAIGDPSSFGSELKSSGAHLLKLFTFMDHHSYTKGDIQEIVAFCRSHSIQLLVTTHKDAVKLRALKDLFEGFLLVYIPVQLEIIKGSDEFIQKVISVCRH